MKGAVREPRSRGRNEGSRALDLVSASTSVHDDELAPQTDLYQVTNPSLAVGNARTLHQHG